MLKFRTLLPVCAFALIGLSPAHATLPAPAYVDAKNGNNANAASPNFCGLKTPCADLNTALSVIGAGASGAVVIVGGGVFGPIVLKQGTAIIGTDPNDYANIVADPTAQPGCVGGAPGSCSGPTNYAVVVDTGSGGNGTGITRVAMRGGSATTSALLFSSGSALQLNYDLFNGGDTNPAVQLYPNNGSFSSTSVYFANSEVTGGSGANAGAIEVIPSGGTNLRMHFNHVQVHSASFGIRTDGSQVTSGTAIWTFISESQFFDFLNAAVNAFSIDGTGQVHAFFDSTRILGANTAALKANGPLSFVTLTNNTVGGSHFGVQVLNSATVKTSGNNTILDNFNDVSGTITAAAMK